MGAARGAVGIADQLAGEPERCALLAHARRPVEEVRMRRVVAQRRLEQALGLVLLADSLEHGEILERARTRSASSSFSSEPSSRTIRSGKSWPSCQ